ncbi:MAG: hypothetical protein H6709_16755 [Kofleriaceae bacterium]|nr:hypothetical protein [Kofleriaceae bacterium]
MVWPAALTADDDNPDLEPLLEAGATRLAGMVGHRGARVTGDDLAAAMAAQGGDLGITVELAEIHYTDGGVITARARGRVRVVDATGVVFDRVIRTDTLVGGRGDRRHAVARAAVEQIVDVAYGRVRELLAARREAR